MDEPIKLWGNTGPNPLKIKFILNELEVPYEVVNISLDEIKGSEYLAVNPNGRIPAIYDPNTEVTLWESGAIIEYLIDKYDVGNKLSFPSGTKEAYLAKQWLYFQTSGQGPYYGQASWFKRLHSEYLSSAVDRYFNEINRVTTVLESQLASSEWLVGNKYSYADISFIPWQRLAVHPLNAVDMDNFPHAKSWLERMLARPTIQNAINSQE